MTDAPHPSHDYSLARLRVATERAERLRRRAEELVDIQVRLARRGGRSWADIGAALGTTRQAVQQRYGSASAIQRRLSPDAAAAFEAAARESSQMGHGYLGTEHVLLGILRNPPAELASAMAGLGITRTSARRDILEIVGSASTPEPGRRALAPRLRRAVEIAGELAASANRYAIGNRELLRGMIAEGAGVGMRALAGLGMNIPVLDAELSASSPG